MYFPRSKRRRPEGCTTASSSGMVVPSLQRGKNVRRGRRLTLLCLSLVIIVLVWYYLVGSTPHVDLEGSLVLRRVHFNNRLGIKSKNVVAIPSGNGGIQSLHDNGGTGRDIDGVVHVVIAANGPYMVPLQACINSILSHTNMAVSFHLLVQPGESTTFQAALSSLIDVAAARDATRRINLSANFAHTSFEVVEFDGSRIVHLIRVWKGMSMHGNPFNFARFFLPELFPDIDDMIYLDPDTIAVDDVGKLFDEFRSRKVRDTLAVLFDHPFIRFPFVIA
eukprot:TRINITY_DN2347_c0_g1_i2.p1 TRINITY_DN2347_c0_g1~~TRINITY_DN2347_c0_g1_i2.p1  ORF type:complete len:278 (-),score=35.90 TRINITY_DN2347_c0_g1_i2:676-1509(-)